MRTTVEFPASVFRAAKARAAERGESLKALLIRAVTAELGAEALATAGARLTLPLFGSPDQPLVRLTNADLERVLAGSDALHAASRARPSRRRRRR